MNQATTFVKANNSLLNKSSSYETRTNSYKKLDILDMREIMNEIKKLKVCNYCIANGHWYG